MANLDDIRQGLKALCAGPINTVVATVKSVDEATLSMVCTPAGGGADYEDVRLKATIGSDRSGVYVMPKTGTSVLLGIINDDPDSTYLHVAEAVDRVVLLVGDSKMVLENGKIEMNGGSLGGLVKVQALTDKISALEGLLNSILSVLKTTSIPLAPSGAYPFAPLYASIMAIAPTTQKSDLEDSKITH